MANLTQPTPSADNAGFDRWITSLFQAFSTRGKWTPVLTFATPGNLSVAYSTQYGDYSMLAGQVVLNFRVLTSTFTHTTAAGNLQLTGLPFVPNGDANSGSFAGITFGGITKAGYGSVIAQVPPASALITFTASGSGVAASNIVPADMPTGGTVLLRGTIIYRI